jgi:hypothetical protein
MRRFTVLALVVAVLVVSVRSNVVAQESTPTGTSTAEHPVVGAWRWNNDPSDPVQYTYAIFHDDGTYQEVSGHDMGIGVWQPTGERTAEIGYIYQDIDPFSDDFEPGTVLIRATVELNEAGDSATATYSVEARTLDGTAVVQFDGLAGTLTRITIESLAFPPTPVAATPTP